MTKPGNTQSQKRFEESLGSLFKIPSNTTKRSIVFLKSSSDEGVIRNGGRNGARYAPQSLLATFKKLNRTALSEQTSFAEFEVANIDEERADFSSSQKKQSERIVELVRSHSSSWLCHIGGGHDHIYPFLSAIKANYNKIIVINIDAHADTRTDAHPHSGTPFRQFASEFQGEFLLYQVGLHPFANSLSTMSELEKGKMSVLWMNDLKTKLSGFFATINKEVSAETAVIFSLDADALSVNQVPGVSAVNADGISLEDLEKIWKEYRNLPFHHSPYLGIYELNPVYDSLASLSMRSLSTFLFRILD